MPMLDGNSAAERRHPHDLAVSEERHERPLAEVIEALRDDVEPLIREAQIDEALMYALCAYAISDIYRFGEYALQQASRKRIIDDAVDEIAREWEE